MIQRSYTLNEINQEALDESLAQALGAAYGGFDQRESPAGIRVTVNLHPAATPAQIEALNSLMAGHDPHQLTADQQAREAQQAKLADARRDYKGTDLDPADFSGESAAIQALARKVAWLEQEIAALRQG